jgi:hypothetical protein
MLELNLHGASLGLGEIYLSDLNSEASHEVLDRMQEYLDENTNNLKTEAQDYFSLVCHHIQE